MKANEDIATFASGDLTLLTYAMHMAETARSGSAKRLFAAYVDAELRRFEAEGFAVTGIDRGPTPANRTEGCPLPNGRRPEA